MCGKMLLVVRPNCPPSRFYSTATTREATTGDGSVGEGGDPQAWACDGAFRGWGVSEDGLPGDVDLAERENCCLGDVIDIPTAAKEVQATLTFRTLTPSSFKPSRGYHSSASCQCDARHGRTLISAPVYAVYGMALG